MTNSLDSRLREIWSILQSHPEKREEAWTTEADMESLGYVYCVGTGVGRETDRPIYRRLIAPRAEDCVEGFVLIGTQRCSACATARREIARRRKYQVRGNILSIDPVAGGGGRSGHRA